MFTHEYFVDILGNKAGSLVTGLMRYDSIIGNSFLDTNVVDENRI